MDVITFIVGLIMGLCFGAATGAYIVKLHYINNKDDDL